MNTKLKVLFLTLPMMTLVSCSSGQKSSATKTETVETKTTSVPTPAPTPAPPSNTMAQPGMTASGQAAPVIVSPNPSLSGSATATPFNQDQMQGMMDQCMAMHKDSQVCSERAMQDCQLSTDATSCQNMMKNVKILRGQ